MVRLLILATAPLALSYRQARVGGCKGRRRPSPRHQLSGVGPRYALARHLRHACSQNVGM